MNREQKKFLGWGLVIACAICLFIAWERYQTNAGNVEAMKRMTRNNPLMSADDMEPAMPAATKYALLAALLTGGGAAACFLSAKSGGESGT